MGYSLFALPQGVPVMKNPVCDGARQPFAVIGVSKFRDLVLVREKAAFDQHRRMAHVCDDEKLLGLRPTIYRLRSGNERILNETSQALAFHVRHLERRPLQEGKPRNDRSTGGHLMIGVVRFNSAR